MHIVGDGAAMGVGAEFNPPASPVMFLRRRPESLQYYIVMIVLRRLAHAEMGIDLRDRRLSVGDRLPAFLIVVIWICELIRSLNNRYRHALKVLYNYDCVEQR
jgi:hypothetical protein